MTPSNARLIARSARHRGSSFTHLTITGRVLQHWKAPWRPDWRVCLTRDAEGRPVRMEWGQA